MPVSILLHPDQLVIAAEASDLLRCQVERLGLIVGVAVENPPQRIKR